MRASCSIFHPNPSSINWGTVDKEIEGITDFLHFCLLKRLNNISVKLPTKSFWFNWLYKNVGWLTTISLQGELWGDTITFCLHSKNILFISFHSNKTQCVLMITLAKKFQNSIWGQSAAQFLLRHWSSSICVMFRIYKWGNLISLE